MALATGCIGMSRDDFARCTPTEFSDIWKVWQQQQQLAERTRWEQTRFLACCVLQPYSKQRITPADVCRFSWEKEREEEAETSEPSTKERFEELARRWK